MDADAELLEDLELDELLSAEEAPRPRRPRPRRARSPGPPDADGKPDADAAPRAGAGMGCRPHRVRSDRAAGPGPQLVHDAQGRDGEDPSSSIPARRPGCPTRMRACNRTIRPSGIRDGVSPIRPSSHRRPRKWGACPWPRRPASSRSPDLPSRPPWPRYVSDRGHRRTVDRLPGRWVSTGGSDRRDKTERRYHEFTSI